MTPELRARLQQHYQAALEMPAGERAQFIAQVCHDNDDLKIELEARLAANHDQANLPDTPLIPVNVPVNLTHLLLAHGEVIDGRFKIVRHLGTGGMGEVYEAIDLELGRVALKTIRPSMTGTPQQLSRFKKEVQLARRVSDPHVCRIHELHMTQSGVDGARNAFLTMEFLDGVTLADRIRDRRETRPQRSPGTALLSGHLTTWLLNSSQAEK